MRAFGVQFVLRALVCTAFVAWSASASASTITWQYDILVHGSTILGNPFQPPPPMDIPLGTPLTVRVTFDTDTPNLCGPGAAGFYPIGIGNSNSATVDFLGYRYRAAGAIENHVVFNSCTPYNGGGVRLFVGAPLEQLDPNGTQVQWLGSIGNLFLPGPPTAWLGAAWPDSLPAEAGQWGGINATLAGSQPVLQFESIRLQAIPEPHTLFLFASGVVVIVRLRRRAAVTQRDTDGRLSRSRTDNIR